MLKTMHNPAYAQRVCANFRARRPFGFASAASPASLREDGEKIKAELAELFMRPSQKSPNAKAPSNPSEIERNVMIKLNCGINRKIGEPNYGSRGASVNVELELESSAAQDTQLLQDRIRKLFALAKTAVDEELGANGQPASDPRPATRPKKAATGARPATEAQKRAVRVLCEKLSLDVDQELSKRFRCSLEELTLPDASTLIDELKKTANGK